MTARRGVARLGRVALLVSATALVVACSSGVTTSSAVDKVKSSLAQALVQAHERALSERAADPTAVDAAAAGRLGDAITGGNRTNLVSATVTSDGVEALTTIGARAEVGGGLFYEQATLGACLLTHATAGSLTGDIGERGTVSTKAVPCPDGIVPIADSAPVGATIQVLQGLSSPVPRPLSPPCFSGSGDCVGG